MSAENPGKQNRPDSGNGRNADAQRQRPESSSREGDRLFAKRVPEKQSTGEVSPEKAARIATIVDSDREAFRSWVETADEPRLDAPDEALRCLIPPRLLELSDDPSSVTINVDREYSHQGKLLMFVVEQRPGTENYEGALAEEVVDEDDIARGVVAPDEYVHTFAMLEKVGEGEDATLHVESYVDREANRGKGIGKDFFDGLKTFAQESGFRYMTAQTNERNVGFFTEAVGMEPFTEVAPEIQSKFRPLVEEEDIPYFTVLDLAADS